MNKKFQKENNVCVLGARSHGVGGYGVAEPNGSDRGDVFLDEVFDDRQPDEEFLKKTDYKLVHPEPEKVWGEYGVFRLVGHGEVTNPNTCGKIVSMKGCLREDLHRIVTLDGKNYAGKVYVKSIFFSCGKASCPKCFKKGWAVREAGRAEERLKEASKRFGLVEHLVASVPVKDYHLPYKSLRRKAVSLLKKLGVIGGMLIFHGFRYRPIKGWYWSPHFHVLGFILGGYSRCRKCKRKNNCDSACDGFDSKRWKLYQKCKWYVKVFGKRKTVFGTAWYQLNHATYDSSVRNFHVATWFGVCSYRKLKITPEIRKELCPICQSELVEIRYTGSNREQFSGKREVFADLVENGIVVWSEKPRISRKGIAVARNPEPYTQEEFDLWMVYAKGRGDNKPPNQVFTCFLCNHQILNINEMRMLDGRRPVHTHCLEKLKEGIKEVA